MNKQQINELLEKYSELCSEILNNLCNVDPENCDYYSVRLDELNEKFLNLQGEEND